MKKARRLLLEGLHNARDMGGFPTRDGGVTRFGVYIRSEAPCGLPQSDVDALRSWGVRDAIDLRGGGEKLARPSDLASAEGFVYHEHPLFDEKLVAGRDREEALRHENGGSSAPPPPPPGGGGHDWGEQYKRMAESARSWALDVLTIAAECPGALLYHCTTGKDRTGLLSCYLLSIAGVPVADIAADYCVSQVFLEPVYERIRSGRQSLGPAPEGEDGKARGPFADEGFFKTPAEAMLTLIGYLNEKYGGVVEFLREIGLPEETMEKIREKFVEY